MCGRYRQKKKGLKEKKLLKYDFINGISNNTIFMGKKIKYSTDVCWTNNKVEQYLTEVGSTIQ